MDELALLLGRDAAKDRAFFGSLGQRRLTLQRSGIDPVLGPGNARVGGHMADSLWVIARDDLDLHALLRKEAERLGRTLADAVLQRQQSQKFQLCGVERRGRIRQCAAIFCQQQHAAALGQQRGQPVVKLPRPAARQHVGRTDDVAPLRAKVFGTVLVRRVERDGAHGSPCRAALPEAGCQGAGRVVIRLPSRVERR